MLGLYGQNGSGKTAIIDTLYYLQRIMIGLPLEKDFADYINVNSNTAEITADFHIFVKEDVHYEVSCNIIMQKK